MWWLIAKYLVTAAVVVVMSEFARRSDRLGGFVAALPLVTLLTLVWLQLERQSTAKAWYPFLYVVPTLPMFLAFPVAAGPAGILDDAAGLHRDHGDQLRLVRMGRAPCRDRSAALTDLPDPIRTACR